MDDKYRAFRDDEDYLLDPEYLRKVEERLNRIEQKLQSLMELHGLPKVVARRPETPTG